ncbi:hypothetical protein GW17_00022523 [Ensete ventricosum]|nr:hypothetical protein GW17_00022523 [Ensete ventricosum]
MVTQSSAREVGCWNGGARVRKKYSSSGRSLTPARRSSRVGSRRNPSDGQISSVVRFSLSLRRRGARTYIVGVVDHPYLAIRLPLWLTLPSYASPTPVVLAVSYLIEAVDNEIDLRYKEKGVFLRQKLLDTIPYELDR